MSKKNKEVNIAVFLIFEGSIPKIIGQKKFEINSKRTISFKGHTFVLIHKDPSFNQNGVRKYFFDYEQAGGLNTSEVLEKCEILKDENNDKEFILRPTGQLIFTPPTKEQLITIDIVDSICNDEIIDQLSRAQNEKRDWFQIITHVSLGIATGLAIGIMLGLSGIF